MISFQMANCMIVLKFLGSNSFYVSFKIALYRKTGGARGDHRNFPNRGESGPKEKNPGALLLFWLRWLNEIRGRRIKLGANAPDAPPGTAPGRSYNILTQILALKAHLISHPCYKYLQSMSSLSLPHSNTLETLYSSFGLENDFLSFLKQATQSFSLEQKQGYYPNSR